MTATSTAIYVDNIAICLRIQIHLFGAAKAPLRLEPSFRTSAYKPRSYWLRFTSIPQFRAHVTREFPQQIQIIPCMEASNDETYTKATLKLEADFALAKLRLE